MQAMPATNLLAVLLLFIAVLEEVHSVTEWKKYENGRVESHRKRVFRPTKNHTIVHDLVNNQHILHSHHGEKKNRHPGKTNDVVPPLGVPGNSVAWEPEHHKNRHHKTEKKLLHFKEPSGSKPEISQGEELPKGLVRIDTNQGENEPKSKKKRSKPDGTTSLSWRKAQGQAESEPDTLKRYQSSKLKGKFTTNKKMVIAKMDGNQKAKQMWKQAFRGQDRITKNTK